MPGLSPEDQELVNAALSKYTAAVPPPVPPAQELAGQALATPPPVAPSDQELAMAALNRNGAGDAPEHLPPAPDPYVAPNPASPMQVAPNVPREAPKPSKQTFQGALGELDQATAASQQAEQQYAGAQAEGLQARETLAADHTAQLEADSRRREEIAKAAQENAAQIKQQHEELQAKADAMQIKDSRSTGMKTLAIIGQAFAGLGDGFARLGGNTSTDYAGDAIRLTHEAVKADLERQQKAKDDAQGKADKKMNEYQAANEFFGDPRKAAEWFEANRSEMYAAHLEQAAAATGSQLKVAEGAKAAAALQQHSAETKARLLGQHEEQQMRSKLLGAKAGGGGSPATLGAVLSKPVAARTSKDVKLLKDAGYDSNAVTGAQPVGKAHDLQRDELEALETSGDITAKQQTQLNKIRGKPAEKRTIPDWDVVDGYSPSEHDKVTAQKEITASNKLAQQINIMKTIASKENVDETDLTHWRNALNSAVGLNSQATGSGTPQEGERQAFLENQVPPTIGYRPSTYRLANGPVLYDHFVRELNDNLRTSVRTYGFQPMGKKSAGSVSATGSETRQAPAAGVSPNGRRIVTF